MDQGRPCSMAYVCVKPHLQIQSMLPTTEFIHVPLEENPSDLCSRGLLAGLEIEFPNYKILFCPL